MYNFISFKLNLHEVNAQMRESIIPALVEVGSMLDCPAPAALTTFQTDITSDLRDNWIKVYFL